MGWNSPSVHQANKAIIVALESICTSCSDQTTGCQTFQMPNPCLQKDIPRGKPFCSRCHGYWPFFITGSWRWLPKGMRNVWVVWQLRKIAESSYNGSERECFGPRFHVSTVACWLAHFRDTECPLLLRGWPVVWYSSHLLLLVKYLQSVCRSFYTHILALETCHSAKPFI